MSDEYSIEPLFWCIVNLIVVVLSIILLIDLIFAVDDRNERPGAVAEYLIYNFGTSALWVVEVSLKSYDAWKNKFHISSASIIAEWVLSLYFVCDSIHLLIKWKVNKKDISWNILELVLGIISYSYITVSIYRDYYRSLPQRNYRLIQDEPPTLTN